jgi:hypothetical protein
MSSTIPPPQPQPQHLQQHTSSQAATIPFGSVITQEQQQFFEKNNLDIQDDPQAEDYHDDNDSDSDYIVTDVVTPEGTAGSHPTLPRTTTNKNNSEPESSSSKYPTNTNDSLPKQQQQKRRIPTKLRHKERQARYIFLLLAALSFLIFIAVVTTIGIINAKDSDIKLQTSFISTLPNTNKPSQFPVSSQPLNPDTQTQTICDTRDFIQMFANVSSVDTATNNFQLHILFFPCGKFAIRDTRSQNARFNLRIPFNMVLSSTTLKFQEAIPMSSQDVRIKFATGDPNSYPFERYTSNPFQISGTYVDPTTNEIAPIPLQMNIVGALQSFSIQVLELWDISKNGTGEVLEVQLQVSRSFSTKFFSVFVMGVMWMLSLLTFALSLTPWIRHYKIEPPALLIGTSLLYVS